MPGSPSRGPPSLLLERRDALDDAVDDALGAGRAARDVDVHRHDLVDSALDVVGAGEDAARAGACPDRDDDLRAGHLPVEVRDDLDVPLVDAAGHEQDVGVLRVARVHDAEALDVVERREAGEDLDVAAVAARPVVVEDPRRALEEGHRTHLPGEEVPSISAFFGAAFLYENEMRELFGVNVTGIALDLKGQLYKTDNNVPFSPSAIRARLDAIGRDSVGKKA